VSDESLNIFDDFFSISQFANNFSFNDNDTKIVSIYNFIADILIKVLLK